MDYGFYSKKRPITENSSDSPFKFNCCFISIGRLHRYIFHVCYLQGLRIVPPEAPVTGYMFGKGIKCLLFAGFADCAPRSPGDWLHVRQGNQMSVVCRVCGLRPPKPRWLATCSGRESTSRTWCPSRPITAAPTPPTTQVGALPFQPREVQSHTVKKGRWFSRPQLGCHLPDSPWSGMLLPGTQARSNPTYGRRWALPSSLTPFFERKPESRSAPNRISTRLGRVRYPHSVYHCSRSL